MDVVKIRTIANMPQETTLEVSYGEYIDYQGVLSLMVDNLSGISLSFGDIVNITEYEGVRSSFSGREYFCEDEAVIETNPVIRQNESVVNMYSGSVVMISESGIGVSVPKTIVSILVSGGTEVEDIRDAESGYVHYTTYSIRHDYFTVPVGLTENVDYRGLLADTSINTIIKETKASLIPDTIDMEKLKYAPCYIGEDGIKAVTGMTFKLHFATRTSGDDGIPDSTWSVDGNGWYYGSGIVETMTETTSSDTASQLGYLRFVDDDVFYRKKKLTKSFIRLSFYSNNDLLTNSLLYYSTVFVDGGELYGKYMAIDRSKRKNMPRYKKSSDTEYVMDSSTKLPVRLNATFNITNEYDGAKSSEGYNIYLFLMDEDYTKTGRTIYMRVEFNHAGNGKTVQFIRPDSETSILNDDSNDTAVEKYVQSAFIPLTAFYDAETDKYLYAFDSDRCYYDEETKHLYIDLYEAFLSDGNN